VSSARAWSSVPRAARRCADHADHAEYAKGFGLFCCIYYAILYYVYIYIYIYIYTYTYLYIYIYTCIYIYKYVYIYMYKYTFYMLHFYCVLQQLTNKCPDCHLATAGHVVAHSEMHSMFPSFPSCIQT
jgi:hypothetical protein